MTTNRAPVFLGFLLAFAASSASAYTFGPEPLSDVREAASAYGHCSDLTPDLLAAYMLAPTWEEVTGGALDVAPSPMTLSRSDKGATLTQGTEGVVWHPGIGAWQLDDIAGGLGTKMSLERFNSRDSAMKVAATLAARYCDPTHPTHPPLYMWSDWYGCATDKTYTDRDLCVPILQDLSKPSTVISPPDTEVQRYGGSEVRTCSLPAMSVPFSCVYVNPSNAQPVGQVAWISASYGPLPLARPFYEYTQSAANGTYEWRSWVAADVPAGQGQSFAARRQYDHDSRSTTCWISPTSNNCGLPTSALSLCDVTLSRGSCGGNTIWVIATLDGFPWPDNETSNPLSWQVSGPAALSSGGVPASFSGEPTGTYTIQYKSGGPAGAILGNPTISQTLSAGGSITFNFNFSSNGVCTASIRTSATCASCYALTLARNTASGGGVPTASPASSLGCGTGQYVVGEPIIITATPANGWNVLDWTGTQNDVSTSRTNSVVMPPAAQTVTVNYLPAPTSGTSFFTVTPCRLIDTRNPTDANGPAIGAGESRMVFLVGSCGIPAEATAVSLNLTVVSPPRDGFLSLSRDVTSAGRTSTINFRQGQVRANNAVIGLSGYGGIAVFGGISSGSANFILDVNGYFALQAPSPVTITELWPRLTAGNYFELSWSQNSDATFAAYRIYRAMHPGVTVADTLIAEITNQQQVTYTDSALQPGRYYYKLVTVNQKGGIAYSEEEYGRVFAPSEVRIRIPGIPQPGDTTFPANVAVPDSVTIISRGGGPAIQDEDGDVMQRRHFSVPITGNLLDGINNLQIIFHTLDLLDIVFSATDDTYSGAMPGQALGFPVPKGGSQLVEFQPGMQAPGGITLVNSAGVHNDSAGALVSIP